MLVEEFARRAQAENPGLAVETVQQAEDREDSLVAWLKAASYLFFLFLLP